MNREKFAWMLSLVLITVLAFSLPGSFAQRDDDYSFVRTIVDIHRQIAANYVDPVNESKLREGAIEGMMSELDPFSVYVPETQQEAFDSQLEGSFKGVGIMLNQLEDGRIEVVTPIDGSPAFRAGVMSGDIILKVNGEAIKEMKLKDVVAKVAGPVGTPVTLTVQHLDGQVVDLTMNREEIIVPTVKGYTRTADNGWDYYVSHNPKIAYIRVTQFTPDTTDKLKTAVTGLLADGMQGLILDLRFNPGGRLEEAVQMVDLFISSGKIVTTKGRNRPEDTKYAQAEGTLPWFPMVVLVNEYSASAAEIVAGSLMDNQRAVVVGQRTYGKGSVQELIPLEGNSGELKLTVAYWYLPSGRLVHRKKDATTWGVEPQIPVAVDPAGEQKILQERYQMEQFRRPVPPSMTQPTTATNPSESASTQPVDPQLQQAVTILIGRVILQNEPRPAAATTTAPTTLPVTQPAGEVE
jgi:carboxyl-terminal processing protease